MRHRPANSFLMELLSYSLSKVLAETCSLRVPDNVKGPHFEDAVCKTLNRGHMIADSAQCLPGVSKEVNDVGTSLACKTSTQYSRACAETKYCGTV